MTTYAHGMMTVSPHVCWDFDADLCLTALSTACFLVGLVLAMVSARPPGRRT